MQLNIFFWAQSWAIDTVLVKSKNPDSGQYSFERLRLTDFQSFQVNSDSLIIEKITMRMFKVFVVVDFHMTWDYRIKEKFHWPVNFRFPVGFPAIARDLERFIFVDVFVVAIVLSLLLTFSSSSLPRNCPIVLPDYLPPWLPIGR